MGRTKGTYTLTSNIEPKVGAPLDARTIVKLLADLTASNTFEYPYKGMKVFVEENNKSYTLVGSDPTVSANWIEDNSGGHTIKNPAGTAMTQRSNLQFVDLTVSDDSTNDVTKVENIHVIQSESELDNLPDGLYMLDDDEGTVIDSDLVGYDNTDSGLEADNVQDAIDEVVEALDDKIDISAKGVANGVAELDSTGKVPSSQLPSYVDDVLEYSSFSAFPAIGETGKIYVALDTNKTYRWGGTEYVEISESIALGETSSTAYRGDRGKTAYDHSQLTSGNPHNVTKSDIGLGNVDNTSDSTKKTNFTGSIASGDTGFTTGGDVYTALGGKADKVSGATNGNLAGLNGTGNLTDSGWNGAKDTTSISGNPISISGLKANQLAKNPIITLEPIQAGSGTPSPVNQRPISGYDKIEVLSCGKNIWLNGNVSGTTFASIDLPYALEPGTYTLSAIVTSSDTDAQGCLLYDTTNNTNLGSITRSSARTSKSFTITQKCKQLTFYASTAYQYSIGDTFSFVDIQIEKGSSATSYEPPVKTTDLSESLGQTVYGGTLDVRTGKLVVDMAFYTTTWTATGGTVLGNCTRQNLGAISNAKGSDVNKKDISNVAELIVSWSGDITHFYIDTSSKALVVTLPNNTPEGTVLQFAYELATPFTIQLTPHEISLLKDYAYVSTNGTNIALDYHNGELASLADVSQLGETLNELGANLLNVVEDVTSKFVIDSTNVYQSLMQVLKIGKMVFINGSIRPQTLTSLQNKRLFDITDSRLLPLVGTGINITANFVPVETAQSTTLPLIVVINSAYNQLRTSNNGAYGGITNITTSSLIIFSGAYICRG